jgi:hypothetical protein
MTISQFVERVEEILPHQPSWRILAIAQVLWASWEKGTISEIDKQSVTQAMIRLRSMDEQHAAVAQELDRLASTTPQEFEPSHVWTLIRAIKIQSQIIDLVYPGTDSCLVDAALR